MRVFIAAAFVAALTASLSAQRTPRTPWGDPDLQGTYTNTYENGTSFERPDQFAGRKLEDVTGDELKKMRLAIQRFSRTSPSALRWTVTVDDPSTWTRPWTIAMPLTADDNPVPSYECHEGNSGRRNILSAARAEERQRAR